MKNLFNNIVGLMNMSRNMILWVGVMIDMYTDSRAIGN